MRNSLFAFVFLSFAACTHRPQPQYPDFDKMRAEFEAKMKGYVGRNLDEYVKNVGIPQEARKLSTGNTIYRHNRDRSPIILPIGGVVAPVPRECTVILETNPKNLIVYTEPRGNACY